MLLFGGPPLNDKPFFDHSITPLTDSGRNTGKGQKTLEKVKKRWKRSNGAQAIPTKVCTSYWCRSSPHVVPSGWTESSTGRRPS